MSNKSSDFKEWADKQLATVKDQAVHKAFMSIINEAESSAQKVEIKSMAQPKSHEPFRKFDRKVIIAEEFDGLIMLVAHGPSKKANKECPKPFKAGKLIQTDYGHLYDQLVKRGLLENTGKTDFIYYFTGEGEPSTKKLNWIGDRIYLSVLMSVLCNNRIPWTHMETVFQGLNTKSMKATLNKSMHPKNGGESYQKHCRFIKSFLSET